MKNRCKWILSAVFAALSFALVQLAKSFPRLVESLYSRGLYRFLARVIGFVTGLFPFSLAQLLLVVSVIACILWVAVTLRGCIRRPKEAKKTLLGFAANLAFLVSAVYLAFLLSCGLNYYRYTFSRYTGLDVRESSVSELEDLCAALAVKTNALRLEVNTDENGVMRLSAESFSQLAGDSKAAYQSLGEQYPVLAGRYPPPKPVAFSRVMSHFNITGIYVPFTYESNVNIDIPDYYIPSTICHELAHLRGFMREDEANYIAYLACAGAETADFRYSGAMLALNHSLNALYRADRDAYWRVADLLSDGVRADRAANSLYWAQFEGKAAQVSTAVNNAYLRSNNQAAGVASYGRMVDLLLAQHRETGHI